MENLIKKIVKENLAICQKYGYWLKNLAKTVYSHAQQFRHYSFDKPVPFNLKFDNIIVFVTIYPYDGSDNANTSYFDQRKNELHININTEFTFDTIYEVISHELTHYLDFTNDNDWKKGANYYHNNFTDRIEDRKNAFFSLNDDSNYDTENLQYLANLIDWVLYHLWSRTERNAYRTKALHTTWDKASSRLNNVQKAINILNQDYNDEDLLLYKELESEIFNAMHQTDRNWRLRQTRGKKGYYKNSDVISHYEGDKKRNACYTGKHFALVKRNFIKKSQDLLNKERDKLIRNWYKYNN